MPGTDIDMISKSAALDRRRWLQVSSLGWLTSALPPLFAGRTSRADEAPAKSRLSPIKSVIVVFHYGGPSHFVAEQPVQAVRDALGSDRTTALEEAGVREWTPGLMDQVVERAASPTFRRWEEQVAHTNHCHRPIRLPTCRR